MKIVPTSVDVHVTVPIHHRMAGYNPEGDITLGRKWPRVSGDNKFKRVLLIATGHDVTVTSTGWAVGSDRYEMVLDVPIEKLEAIRSALTHWMINHRIE